MPLRITSRVMVLLMVAAEAMGAQRTSPQGDRPLAWRFTEVVRIGGAETGPESFDRVSAASVATNGIDRIYVLHRDAAQIHVFDAAGNHQSTLGRRGDGPGEFRAPMWLAASSDGTVMLYDYARLAMVRWNAAGRPLSQLPFDATRGYGVATGSLFGFATMGEAMVVYRSRFDGRTSQFTNTVQVVRPNGAVNLDSVVTRSSVHLRLPCGNSFDTPHMFAPRLLWDANNVGVATAVSGSYAITIRSPSGAARLVRRNASSVPTTQQMVARMVPNGWRHPTVPTCSLTTRQAASLFQRAPTLPLINGIALGPVGTLWVERFTFPDEPPRVDVFDRSGLYLGTAPHPLPLGFLGDDLILFPVVDPETDIQSLGIYRITRP